MATKSTKSTKSTAAKGKATKAAAKGTKVRNKGTVPNGPVVQAMSKALKAHAAKGKAKPAKPATKSGTYSDMASKYTGPSKVESPVHAMWELCNSMVDHSRKAVIAAAVAKGISYYTARTQYQLWLTAYRNSK